MAEALLRSREDLIKALGGPLRSPKGELAVAPIRKIERDFLFCLANLNWARMGSTFKVLKRLSKQFWEHMGAISGYLGPFRVI